LKLKLCEAAYQLKALIVYWSKSGNTEKVARAISAGLTEAGASVAVKTPAEAQNIDYFDYDFVCVGSPSYQWMPAEPMKKFLEDKLAEHRKTGKIKPSAPKIPGKNALVFVTYSGPHTGLAEATPAGKFMGQFFEHIGFSVVAEWYVLCEFHGSVENSTLGRMGDIRGKPTSNELKEITAKTKKLAEKISA
jgi:flavodoxin